MKAFSSRAASTAIFLFYTMALFLALETAAESPANIYRYLLEGEDGLSDEFINNINQRCEKDDQQEDCPILLRKFSCE